MLKPIPLCAALLCLCSFAVCGADAAPTEKECTDFAKIIEADVASGAWQLVDNNFDMNGVIDKTMAGYTVAPATAQGFRTGLKSGFSFGKVTSTAAQGGSYRFVRLRDVKNQRVAVFRLLTASGLNYHELLLQKSPAGKIRIGDVFIYMTGEYISETFRRTYVPIAVSENRGLLEKLVGSDSDMVKNLPKIQAMQAAHQRGQAAQALKLYNELPPSVQADKNMLVQRITITQAIGEKEYDAAFLAFRKHFPNDTALHLLGIDFWLHRKNYDETMKCVDAIDKNIGGDPYLDAMRANILIQAKDLAKARGLAQKVLKELPELAESYWPMITIHLEEKDHAATLKMLQKMRADLSWDFGDLTLVPLYADFVKSKEYQEWLKQN